MKQLDLTYEVVEDWLDTYEPIFQPDIILTILNGARFIGDHFSEKFKCPQGYVTIKSYDGNNRKELQLIGEFPKFDYTHKNILIVDDICDSGTTISFVLKQIFEIYKSDPLDSIMFYTIIEKRNKPRFVLDENTYYNFQSSCIIPDTNVWIKFPWE